MEKRILVIDGQGGRMGAELVKALRQALPEAAVMAVGANSLASAAMLKAGADPVATGENAVIVACRRADLIVGPLGIVVADALFGEITPAMAVAVGQSAAQRILLPLNRCETWVACPSLPAGELIQQAVARAKELLC